MENILMKIIYKIKNIIINNNNNNFKNKLIYKI